MCFMSIIDLNMRIVCVYTLFKSSWLTWRNYNTVDITDISNFLSLSYQVTPKVNVRCLWLERKNDVSMYVIFILIYIKFIYISFSFYIYILFKKITVKGGLLSFLDHDEWPWRHLHPIKYYFSVSAILIGQILITQNHILQNW